MKIKKIIAKEGLIILVICVVLYLSIMFVFQKAPLILPKYKVEFNNGTSYIVTIYPEIVYSMVNTPEEFVKEALHPSSKIILQRIEEFAKAANINSKPKHISCVNNWQLSIAEIYSFFLLQHFVIKVIFVYLILLFVRFVFWALKTLR